MFADNEPEELTYNIGKQSLKMEIAREIISLQPEPTYKVRVESIKHKMKTWEPRRDIASHFAVDGVKLWFSLHPNGATKEDVNHVSFFIWNASGVAINLLCDVNMGSKAKFDDVNSHIKAGTGWGWRKFYNHKDDKDNEDKDFEITVTIKKMWKQLQEDGDNNNQGNNSQRVEKRLERLEKRMKRLENSEGGVASVQTYPECPVCLEDMVEDTRIMMCGLGHLICGGCHEKLVSKTCPSCRKEIIGRCQGMEAYVRNLYA